VKSNKHRSILSAAKMYINYSSFSQHKSFVDIRKRFLQKCLHTRVGSLKLT